MRPFEAHSPRTAHVIKEPFTQYLHILIRKRVYVNTLELVM